MRTRVQEAVIRHFRISYEELVGTSRSQSLVVARHIAHYLEREQGKSYPEIGRLYNRDHTTPIAAWKHVTERVTAGDARYVEPINILNTQLNGQQMNLPLQAPTVVLRCPVCGTNVAALQQQLEMLTKQVASLTEKLGKL